MCVCVCIGGVSPVCVHVRVIRSQSCRHNNVHLDGSSCFIEEETEAQDSIFICKVGPLISALFVSKGCGEGQ